MKKVIISAYLIVKETLNKSFAHIVPSDFSLVCSKNAGMLTHCEDFLGKPAENMQTRCVK